MARNNSHKPLPENVKRKDDLTKRTEVFDTIIQRQLQKEKKLFPLRITSTTVIYVTKDKLNKEYAEAYKRDKMGVRL